MVIKNGLFLGKVMIEPPRGARLQHEIFVNELHKKLEISATQPNLFSIVVHPKPAQFSGKADLLQDFLKNEQPSN